MEAIGKLAGGVAHDFNNLLTVINGYASFIRDQLPPSDPNREMLEAIAGAGERAASLTRQLLAFSRQQVVAPRVLDVGAVVGNAEKMLRRLIGEDVRLRVASEPRQWASRLDDGQLEQIVLNLAVNARDAMPQGGDLSITTGNFESARPADGVPPGRYAYLEVADSGVGMDAATRARIFEPFFTTKGDKGTGLGLATVYGIVKQSDGHIAVDSAPGRGTRFRVFFPAAAEAHSPPPVAVQSGGRRPGGTETILLVEDEDAVRSLTRHVLKGCGYTILEARNGWEAINLAGQSTTPVHLLVTDVVMPHLGGRETAERLTAMYPALRVLFVSGYLDDAIIRHGVCHTETNFLHKPYTPAALAHKIREILDAGR
jgi:CheY-like chemotaxis protein